MAQKTVTNTCEIINNAIVAHFVLGHQLRAAAYEENRGLPVRAYKNSQKCGLGKLIAFLKENDQMTDRAKEVDGLHLDLHDAACGVAALIATGHFDEAIDELSTGYYAEAAAALTKALSQWKMETA
ncbi:MAG: hypothetical protein VX083_14940 [Pseudomonadota bacterium]|uniref:Uncharacterized protein n=1 Tax=Thalassovita autumnalis TaxID=2072972 RepID=A0A0P1FLL6_9RHOB|nr:MULTISPECIES: hypothetical protein [Thalassovita]MEC7962705.1 hypothetical protein [Pseudomonadota bacterium]MEC8294786.1 hypothetical protein [Pseudomonadota bacterium]CUH69047.1 hypothetical protein TL5118_03006 [Thalassovita autumnalis]CUH73750.1 hypothetical protein TL5120_03562 [Thalassovita autumnalis]|tara:strand:- start:281 stop:658 length:378 start_codon:yes stop_codon:yes gene_type:complete